MEAPLPTTNYDRLVMSLVLVSTARTKEEFSEAEALVYELAQLLKPEQIEKAITFVSGLEGVKMPETAEDLELPLITGKV